MRLKNFFPWLLALLGFQMQGCFPFSGLEYGCLYTEFKTSGTIQDENGKKIKNAHVNVKVQAYDSKNNIVFTQTKNESSDNIGKYEVKCGECDLTTDLEKIEYEVITNGFKDTTRKEIGKNDIKIIKKGDEKRVINQEINVTLKSKL
ncbi:MAG: hypothetical protein IKK68_04610 [Paludibacteraceae bacterium]|nr:hypothetical protein [Paludibacteraceae bacterium]